MKNVVNEINVVYKPTEIKTKTITKSNDAAQIARAYFDNHLDGVSFREHFLILCLNRANIVQNIYHVSTGGVSRAVVDAKVIFGVALKSNTSSLILVHNHPSNNLTPSQADKDLTKDLVQIGKLLHLYVLDHLILGYYGHYSMADEGDI